MSALTLAPWLIAALCVAIAGLLFWRLGEAQEKIGTLQQANQQLTVALTEKDNALKARAKTDNDVNKLPPADVLERLR